MTEPVLHSDHTRSSETAWHADRRIIGVLVLAGILLFGASLDDGFHFDDDLILNDANVTNAGRWMHFLNPLRLRQVTFFTFYLNHRIGGDDATGFHAVNVVLHVANALLVYFVLGPVAGGWLAAAAAAIFLVHPVQTEAVLYVYQRSTLLAAFFSLAALAVLVRHRNAPGGDSRPVSARTLTIVVVLFALAAASKESALAVPLVVAVAAGLRTRTAGAVFIAVGAAATFAVALLAWLGENTVGIGALESVSPATYFRTELGVLLTYLRLLVFPVPQSLEYDFVPSESWFDPMTVAGGLVLAALVAVAVILGRRQDTWPVGLGIAAFLILLAPTSGVIPSADFAFEHRLYLPMIGATLVAAFALSRLPHRRLLLIAVLLPLAALTVSRSRVWANDVALWEDTVAKAPGKARAWFNLGGAYMDAGDPRALETFSRALELDPESVETMFNIGVLEQRRGRESTALPWYERALALDPAYWPAANNIGNLNFGQERFDEAVRWFEHVLELNPDYWPAQYNLALAYTALGRPDLAVPRLRIVLDWSAEFDEARYLLALSLERMGLESEAQNEFEILGGRESLTGTQNPQPLEP